MMLPLYAAGSRALKSARADRTARRHIPAKYHPPLSRKSAPGPVMKGIGDRNNL
jgi:hypothetical protein